MLILRNMVLDKEYVTRHRTKHAFVHMFVIRAGYLTVRMPTGKATTTFVTLPHTLSMCYSLEPA